MSHHDPHAFMPYPVLPIDVSESGPLAGLRFGVKDLFHVSGYPTSMGQPILAAWLGCQTKTAPVVQKLLNAGATMAGKTVCDEFAFSMTGDNIHYGAPRNGAAPMRISGGSSSGSASAVSNGMVDFALGTDTGGSVRAPASHCGLVGLRPTHGRVSLSGGLPLAPSFDTCGWFARDIHVFARVGEVLLEGQDNFLPQRPRLLLPTDLWSLVSSQAHDALVNPKKRVNDVLGADHPVQVVLDNIDRMYWAFRYLQGKEAWESWGAFITQYAPTMGHAVAERMLWSSKVTDDQARSATQFRVRFTAHIEQLLGDDGVLLLPTMPDIAPLKSTSEEAIEDYRNRAIRMLCVSGLSGLPQISLPMAKRDGAPLGLSLLGPRGSDRSLISLSNELMTATN
jgi:amidase